MVVGSHICGCIYQERKKIRLLPFHINDNIPKWPDNPTLRPSSDVVTRPKPENKPPSSPSKQVPESGINNHTVHDRDLLVLTDNASYPEEKKGMELGVGSEVMVRRNPEPRSMRQTAPRTIEDPGLCRRCNAHKQCSVAA